MAKADKLLEQAKEHFGAGESALAVISGAYETKIGKHDTVRNGVLIATNQRLLFYAKKLTGFDLEALPYERISSLEMGKKLGGRWIKFFASGNTVSMKWIQDDLTAFVNTVQSQMAGTDDSTDEGADATPFQPDVPAEAVELQAQEPKAKDEVPMAPTKSSDKASGGCFQVVVIAMGVLLGGIVVLVGLFAIFGPDEDATSSTGEDGDVSIVNSPTGTLLGRWPDEVFGTTRSLVYRDGVMYFGRGSSPSVVVERPSGLPHVRKFDPNPDERHGEYFTISASGVMRWFAWEGREFDSVAAERFHPDAMSIGFNPVERACIPTELSPLALETMKLYEELHSFKDTNAFSTFGFSQNGPYHAWLETVQRTRDREGGMAVQHELGVLPGDLLNLGLSYLRSESDQQFVRDMERRFQAGIALAECRGQ